MGRRARRAAIATVLAGVLYAPGAAGAATTVSIATTADPTEDVTYQLTFAGNADTARRLYVRVKPTGGTPCAATYEADDGNRVIVGRTVQGAYSEVENHTTYDSGNILYCAWIQATESATSADAAASLTVPIRVPHATGSVQAPTTATAGQVFQLGITIQTEVSRRLYVDVNAPGVPCGANYEANQRLQRIFRGRGVEGGPTTFTENYTPPSQAGTFTVCSYVQETESETVPEATFSGQFVVQVPVTAACVSARNRAALHDASAAKHLKNYKKYKKAAKKARGKRRRTLSKKATKARRAWKEARAAADAARNDIASEC